MIVHNFHGESIFTLPAEANPILVIDADAVLSRPIASQRLQTIARRRPQIVQAPRLIQHQQLSSGNALNAGWQPARCLVIEQPLGFPTGETAYHPAHYNACRYAMSSVHYACFLGSLQGTGALFDGLRKARSVLECASPGALELVASPPRRRCLALIFAPDPRR